MKIETKMSSNTLEQMPAVETLESRLLRASGNASDVAGSKRQDLDFEELYQQLLAMEGQGEKAIYAFLRSLRGADGIAPRYQNAQALMDLTKKVMLRLNDDELGASPIYKEIQGVNGLAFFTDMFVRSLMRDVFQPMGDESWEKSEW